MEVLAFQLDIAWEDKSANFRRVEQMAGAAEPAPGSLLVLPEMFATGFSMNAVAIAEPLDGPTPVFLAELAVRHQSYVIGGAAIREGGAARNEALVFDPRGKRISRYAKMHPFTPGQEDRFYDAGKDVALFDWLGCSVAPTVCYDLRFPELYRRLAMRGAEVMPVIANWPGTRVEHWTTLLRARAIENQAYVIGVNRAGRDPTLVYPGQSLIIDPHGHVLADGTEVEGILRADIDPAKVREWRQKFPVLRDVRADVARPAI